MESIATRVTHEDTRYTSQSADAEYSTSLNRALSVSDLIAYGMVYMLPISPFAMYGIIASVGNGMVPLIYILSVIAMGFTARSYQVLSKEFPNAGSAYTYARHGIGEAAGFFAGWLLFLDYIISPGLLAIISAAAIHGHRDFAATGITGSRAACGSTVARSWSRLRATSNSRTASRLARASSGCKNGGSELSLSSRETLELTVSPIAIFRSKTGGSGSLSAPSVRLSRRVLIQAPGNFNE